MFGRISAHIGGWSHGRPRCSERLTVLDHAKPEREAEIQPHGMADHFGGEAAWFTLTRTDPTTSKRKHYIADFKMKIALEAIRAEPTTSQLASKRGVRQTMLNEWKRAAVSGLASIVDGKGVEEDVAREGGVEKLHAKIGQVPVERDFWRNLRSMSLERRRRMVDREHPRLSTVRQRKLMSIHRSGLYNELAGETALNLASMRSIDARFMETPYMGRSR
jgi:putative transposase